MLSNIRSAGTSARNTVLGLLASHRRSRLRPMPIIAVTGSSGKSTSIKILDHILKGQFKGGIGIGSNRLDAIYRKILTIPTNAGYLIQELSAEFPGALDDRLKVLRPDIGIVVAVGLDHRQAYRNREAVGAEKGKLVERLPVDGFAILNGDDPNVASMAQRTSAQVITFGMSEGVDIRAIDVSSAWPGRLSFTVVAQGASARIETQLFGKHFTHCVLAAIAAALQLGFSLDDCADRLKFATPVYQRMSVHAHPSGAWLIADTYKAPGWSLDLSFDVLDGAKAPRTTVVIGTISDTTGDDRRNYPKAGLAALRKADRVVFVGEKASSARKLMNTADADRVTLIASFSEFIDWLDENLMKDEVVLLKSSAKSHLERAFLFPQFGRFCPLDRCTQKGSCIKCSVTDSIPEFRDPDQTLYLMNGPEIRPQKTDG